ncbi:MDR family MFS transporter [Mechercharimyces sp. CAU 1602]|uniref:MDR family MFS transporter n=1 Tax=Mechercharimyces sp. CAU 1602 TaxID=2973933 RepID=UPI002163DFCE|nr:MDR family MFS transporter [Mechercharimyces sp. CAU 1602]MCS1350396.1 MFS transporter [Mechercharimyces sp. CAU 1602]
MEHLEQRTKIAIMIAIMSTVLFSSINMTIVGTSLPKIIAQIGGMEYFDWVFTAYMLSATVTAMLVGKLSDMYGRKVFILIGIVVFMTGAFFCGTSDNIYQLILFRTLQGFGGGMIMSSAFATVGDLFSPRERGRWQGLLGATFGLSSVVGPTLGGYIVDNFDWHWVFWIFLPIGFLAFTLIWRLYPKHDQVVKEKIDYLGSISLSIFIISLLLGFSWAGSKYEWGSAPIIGLFSLAAFSILAFIFIEKRAKSPILPLFLFRNSTFTLSNIAGFLIGMGMFVVIMYTPFYVQGVLGRSATVSGLVELVITITMVISSIIVGQLITKFGRYKALAVLGTSLMAVGLYLNSYLTATSPLTQMLVNLVIIGLGLGITMPVFTISIQNSVKHKYLGVSTSVMQVSRQIGGTIGVAMMSMIMGNRMEDRLQDSLPPQEPLPSLGDEMNVQDPRLLMDPGQLENIRSGLPSTLEPAFDTVITTLREALSYSVTSIFFISSIIITVAAFITLFIKEIPLRTSNIDEDETDNNDDVILKVAEQNT